MAYTNNNKKVHDTPVWLPTGQFRSPTGATASMTTCKSGCDRYVYYTNGTLFYRYDTYKDVPTKLASPVIAGVTATSIRFDADSGFRSNCLGATSTGASIAGLNSQILVGKKIRVMTGAGAGQERTITAATNPIIEDTGMVTAASATSLTDTTRRWEINQYIGFQVRVVYGTGSSQVRKVLYNDATTLYFQDANYQQLEAWNNTAFSATAPYAVPVNTAGFQANYYIESTDITVDSAWAVTPDFTSTFNIIGGGVWMVSAVATAPWSSLQFYDVLSDTWTTKTALGGNLLAALGTDFSLEVISAVAPYKTGTATSGTSRTLTDTTLSLTPERYINYELRITGGTGVGQKHRIISSGTNYFEVQHPFTIAPDATSTYAIYADTDALWLVGNGDSSMYKYSKEYDQWITGHDFDYGQARNASVQFAGQEAQAISTGVRNTGGITSLSATPTAGGTGYAVGDIFNITTGGTVGKGRVEAVSAGGVVTSVSLYSAGLTYTTGAGKATTIISGAGNNGLTVNILAVGTVGRITTTTNVNFYKGDTVVVKGASESAWNTSYAILAIDALTTFDVVITATANLAATASQSTTLIVDSDKNWIVNEHAGKIVKLDVAGTAPTTQLRRITSNTATTITVATIVAAGNGTSRYAIIQPKAFGADRENEATWEQGEGYATGGSTTTLVDSTKNWATNKWAGYKFRINAGTGLSNEITVISNTSNTLTYALQTFTPDTTTRYDIMETYGVATSGSTTTLVDTTKNWVVNQWSGKRIVYIAGTGQRFATTVASNTANTITFATGTAPDTTTMYTILQIAPRSTGTEIRWMHGNTDTTTAGNKMISFRGGNTNTMDVYDISQNRWNLTQFFSPQSELLNTGSSYTYDGVDTFYLSIGVANDFIYILAMNVNTFQIDGAFQTTVLQGGTAHIGNLMEIVESPDGGKFLFIGINSSRLCYKTLIY
jgi:hypothetical protein